MNKTHILIFSVEQFVFFRKFEICSHYVRRHDFSGTIGFKSEPETRAEKVDPENSLFGIHSEIKKKHLVTHLDSKKNPQNDKDIHF